MRFSLKLLSRISEKVIKYVFRWKRRQINKNEKFSNFQRCIAKLQPLIKLEELCRKILQQNSYLRKILRFSKKKKKKNRKMISFSNFCSFFETETLEQNIRRSHKICFFRCKRREINRKIRNFQIFEKISFIARLQPLIKLEVIMPSLQIFKNMLIRVILHAEFITAMKTVQNPTIVVKNAKKKKKKQKNDQFW